MDKREFLNECFTRVESGRFPVVAKNKGNGRKLIVVYASYNNLVGSAVKGFLFPEPDFAREIIEQLDKAVFLWDKNILIQILANHWEDAQNIMKERIDIDYRLKPFYINNGVEYPLFVSNYPAQINEALAVYMPLFNGQTEVEGTIIGVSATDVVTSAGILRVEKISSHRELEAIMEREKSVQLDLKKQFPEVAKLIEQEYPTLEYV